MIDQHDPLNPLIENHIRWQQVAEFNPIYRPLKQNGSSSQISGPWILSEHLTSNTQIYQLHRRQVMVDLPTVG